MLIPSFVIYKFKLEQNGKRHLCIDFDDSSTTKTLPSQYETLNEYFESFFPEAQKSIDIIQHIRKMQGDVEVIEADRHENEILQHRDHIVVIKVQANKIKNTDDEDWKKSSHPHHPACRVLIDFRPGHCYMAIEKKSSAFKSTEQLADLLGHSFNEMLADSGVAFYYDQLTKTQQFWEAVYEIRDKLNDRIKKVEFAFSEENEQQDDGTFAYLLSCFARKLENPCLLSMLIEDDEKLKKVEDDLTRMAELCYRDKNYALIVTFRTFGSYHYGQEVKAQLGVKEEVINDFISGVRQLNIYGKDNDEELNLPEWFDKVDILFGSYEQKSSFFQKGNTTGRIGTQQ